MKTNRSSIRLLALLSISALACFQLRADDGIAANAMAAQKSEKTTAPEVRTTPPQQRVTDKQTGIKTSEGTLIHPVVQSRDIPVKPVPRRIPNQEDYHIQQTY